METNNNNRTQDENRGRYIAVCLLACVAVVMASSVRNFVYTTFALARREFDLSDMQQGLLASSYAAAILLLSIPAGLLVDKGSRKALLAIGILVGCFAYVLRFVATTGDMYIAAGLFDALAYALLTMVLIAIVAGLPPLARGAIIGAAVGGGTLVAPVVLIAGSFVLAQYGWRMPHLVAAVFAVLLAVVVLLVGKGANDDAAHANDNVLGNSTVIHSIVAGALLWMLGVSVSTFAPALAMRLHGVSGVEFAKLYGLWSLGLIPSFGLMGAIATALLFARDVRRVPLLLAAASIVMGLALLLGTVAPNPALAGFGFSLMRAASWFLFSSALTAIACAVIPKRRGLFAGIFLASCYGSQLLGPLLLGLTSDAFRHLGAGERLRIAMQISSIIVVWALIHLWMAWRRANDDTRASLSSPSQ